MAPPFLHTLPPSGRPQLVAKVGSHNTHTLTHSTLATSSLIQFFSSALFFSCSFPCFFLASSSPLFCFAPDKPLFHIVGLRAEGQPLFTSTSQLIRALYQPLGKRCGLKLRKPAGCQQTSICKLGLRNVCLLTKRKASGVMCLSVCFSACVCEKHRTYFVQRGISWSPHSLACCSGDRCCSPSHLLNAAGGQSFLLHTPWRSA